MLLRARVRAKQMESNPQVAAESHAPASAQAAVRWCGAEPNLPDSVIRCQSATATATGYHIADMQTEKECCHRVWRTLVHMLP